MKLYTKLCTLAIVLFSVMFLSPSLLSCVFAEGSVDSGAESKENLPKCGDNIVWHFDEEGTLTITGSGRMWDLTDQQRANNEWLWPADVRAKVRKVILSEGITYIGIGAFEEMATISEVHLPATLETIGHFAFRCCSALKSIDLPEGLQCIDGSFEESGLESVTIPSTVSALSGFVGCRNLKNVRIKAYTGCSYTVTYGLFSACPNLERIDVDEGHMALYSIDGVLFLDMMLDSMVDSILVSYPQAKNDRVYQVPQFCTTIGSYAFSFSDGEPAALEEVIIPEGCTRIESNAFFDCWNLTALTIPNSVSHIGIYAFQNCRNISAITLSSSVSYIGNYAFDGCESLENIWIDDDNAFYQDIDGVFFNADASILLKFPEGRGGAYEIPEGTTSIDTGAIRNSKELLSVVVPDSVLSIGSGAFMECTGLKSIKLSNNLSTLENWLFFGCSSLISVDIPASVTNIVSGAFENCAALKTVVIPDSVRTIGDSVFTRCSSLESITIPDSVTYLGPNAFWSCTSLVSVEIGNGVNKIEDFCFFECSSLESIAIGKNVTAIGACAFIECNQLKNVYYYGTEAEWNAISMDNRDDPLNRAHVYFQPVPQWSEPTYEWSADNRTVIARRICIENNADVEEEIAEATIALAKAPTANERGETTYTVMFENKAFTAQVKTVADIPALSVLQVVTLPSMLQCIENEAFMGVISIEAVLIPDGCESIGLNAFANCPELIYVRIPASVSSIAENAFEGSHKVRIEWVSP